MRLQKIFVKYFKIYSDGYDDIDDLFNECVTKNLEKFEYESTVSEE